MNDAHDATTAWLSHRGRIEDLHQAAEDGDTTALRALMAGAWQAGYDAGQRAGIPASTGTIRYPHAIGGRDE